ncbi:MAG: chromate efflux transporter [Asticcacaulis sp.]
MTGSKTPDFNGQLSLRAAIQTWVRIAALSFGGPAGQIAIMHRILVDEKRWIGEQRFLHALNYCMLLPGPEAQQLATYIGWLMHGVRGGLIAGGLFILPGFLSILALSLIYSLLGDVTVVSGLFFGLQAAVLAIVVQAVIRIGRRALFNRAMIAIAAGAFVGLFVFRLPFPLIISLAALIGFVGARSGAKIFAAKGGHGTSGEGVPDSQSLLGETLPAHAQVTAGWSVRIAVIFLALWLTPVAMLLLILGPDNVFSEVAVFFSKMAVVTFGGAYAVLGYIAQEGVTTYGWLQPAEMLDGLAMAETTPGPLIQVVQFVGYMGAFRDAGGLHPVLAGILSSVLATWVTFVPCFLWIFLGAPFVEGLKKNAALSSALAAITAAVVGVVLNLALWFAIHALFKDVAVWRYGPVTLDLPSLASMDFSQVSITLIAFAALFRLKLGVMWVLAITALIGIALSLLGFGPA